MLKLDTVVLDDYADTQVVLAILTWSFLGLHLSLTATVYVTDEQPLVLRDCSLIADLFGHRLVYRQVDEMEAGPTTALILDDGLYSVYWYVWGEAVFNFLVDYPGLTDAHLSTRLCEIDLNGVLGTFQPRTVVSPFVGQ